MHLHIQHVIPYLGRAMGGPVFGLAAYAEALAGVGCRVSVAGVCRVSDGERVTMGDGVECMAFNHARGGMFRWSPALARGLAATPADVIHSHGLWTYVSIAAARAARRQNLPHVIAPCGMLQRGALRRSAFKKRVCRALFQDRILRAAVCLHAKSDAEYRGIRELGFANPIAVIPNPVSPPGDAMDGSDRPFRAAHGIPPDERIVLYLGRLHPVKGLARLIGAWAGLGDWCDGWRLVLAGPDEGGHRRELERVISAAGVTESVTFTGPLQGASKWGALRACDLFVMPSDFENFGAAIAEALLCGKPVITTTGTPWQELRERGAGWWVAPTPPALADALRTAMLLDDGERQEMGARGRRIAARFAPQPVAGDLVLLYEWILGHSKQPDFVY